MERWQNRVALVTGAGSGIGKSISQNLTSNGMKVIGCARNIAPIQELANTLSAGKLIPYKCDLNNETEIEEMFSWLEKNHGGIDVLVNNAGVATNTPLLEICGAEMESMLKLNVVGVVLCSKLAVKSMIARGVNGHIFNLNSMLGHSVVGIMNFYASTKYAITALTEGLRKELSAKGSRIRVTALSPGRTETNFHVNLMGEKNGKEFYAKMENLTPQNVADALIYALSAPESVQVYDVKMQPTNVGNPSDYK